MEAVRWTRLRWRLRGAWQWPTFLVATVAEGGLLNALPVWGDGPGGFVPAVLIAGFLNLFVVAVAAPLAGRLVRRRRRDLPRAIASDYAGTALLVALLATLAVAGVVHHGDVTADRDARAESAAAVAHYVRSQEPSYVERLAGMTTIRIDTDVYRTCVPDADGERALCLFVNTGQSPPGLTRDLDEEPNSIYRQHGGF